MRYWFGLLGGSLHNTYFTLYHFYSNSCTLNVWSVRYLFIELHMLVVARLLQCSDIELELPQVPWQNILAAKTRTERHDCVKKLINYPQDCMGKSERTESYAISNWNLNFVLRKRRLMPIVAHKTRNRFLLQPDYCCKGDWLEKPSPTSARVTLNVRVLMELGKGGKAFWLCCTTEGQAGLMPWAMESCLAFLLLKEVTCSDFP